MIPDIKTIKLLSDEFHLGDSKETDFMKHLADAINYRIENDFPGLVQILYRMDISESTLKEMLALNAGHDAGLIIGQLLVDRERQKILSREQFKQNDDIPEDEKW
jgi:hypothetical protein